MHKKTKEIRTIFLLHFSLVLSGNCCLGKRKKIQIKINPPTKNVIVPVSTDEDLESENFVEEKTTEESPNQFETSISKDKEKTDKTDYDLVNKSTNELIKLNQNLDQQTQNKENDQQRLVKSQNKGNHNVLENFTSDDSSKNNRSLVSDTGIVNPHSDKRKISPKPSLKLKNNEKPKDSGSEKRKSSISKDKPPKKYKGKGIENISPLLSVVKADRKSQKTAQETISEIESEHKVKEPNKS